MDSGADMSAQTQSQVHQQRQELVNKVELEVDRKINLGDSLIQYHRLILQDLPFDGHPELMSLKHRQAIDKLLEKTTRYHIDVKKIIGYASEVGEADYNLNLSQQRADAVFAYLVEQVEASDLFDDSSFYANIQVQAMGESKLPAPTGSEQDNPLNRRVEIVYRLKYVYPSPPGGVQPSSKFWKVDFGPAGAGSVTLGPMDVGINVGAGKLTMLPDPDTNQTETLQRNMTFEQLGLSFGLMSKLKKLKFIEKLPGMKNLLKMLDTGSAANYPKTTALLTHIGFSVDILSSGGEFLTQEALTFEQMQAFNFATFSGSLSILGKGEGSLLMLHSEYFFASTVIFGLGQNIAVPDLEFQFVPAGLVKLS